MQALGEIRVVVIDVEVREPRYGIGTLALAFQMTLGDGLIASGSAKAETPNTVAASIAARPIMRLPFVGEARHGAARAWPAAALRRRSGDCGCAASGQGQRQQDRCPQPPWRVYRLQTDAGALGIEMILPDWFYVGVLDDTLVLTIDRAYLGTDDPAARRASRPAH